MPRYFIDVTDAGKQTRDEHGADFADDQEARDQAVALLPHMAKEELPDGDRHEFVATVRNAAGDVVYEASLALYGRWWPGRK